MMSNRMYTSLLCFLFSLPSGMVMGQTAQVGVEKEAGGTSKIRVEYVHYRPARWEAVSIKEAESEYTNQGGLLYFYLTNVSGEPVDLKFWRMNNHDESYWLLNHFIAWHRLLKGVLQPGESTVLEIDGITRDFGLDAPFTFSFVDATWEPCIEFTGCLRQDPVNISYIRLLPDMQQLEINIRNTDAKGAAFSNVAVLGSKVVETCWRGQQLSQAGQAIARVKLDAPVEKAALLIIKVSLKTADRERAIYAHRRAFSDFFPVGTWGITSETQEFLHRDHVDTVVQGGGKDDPFFRDTAPRLGFRAMVHTGEPVNVDMVRDLSGHPSVACWMLRDEPDWSTDPQVMLFCDQTVRAYDKTVPTFLNLCRNVKFFEYAPISDIPGHDHYCVTAPSSSIWPKPYGTHLEETGYYTRDLKYASEPKPIWVWSQGNHDGWEERPKRPVPTAEEIAAQLVLNLGRGAKGILWFTYNQAMCEKYPDTREAMRGWNRVMAVLRDEFLASEPAELSATAQDKIDIATLLSWDNLIVCLTNLEYEIHPEAYPFKTRRNVKVSIPLPEWIAPKFAFTVSPDGIHPADVKTTGGRAQFALPALRVAQVIVLANEPAIITACERRFQQVLKEETGK